MSRSRISISVFLSFLMLVFLMVTGCGSSGGGDAAAPGVTTYSISGTVKINGDEAPLPGVTITLTGDSTGTAITDGSGYFSFSGVLAGANVIVTPSSTVYELSGAHVDITNISSDWGIAFSATDPTFSQADLTGTWRMNVLVSGFESGGSTPKNEWKRGVVTIAANGVATCVSMSDSTGATTCPAGFNLTIAIDPLTGVITQSGTHAVEDGGHMTMTANKNFAAGIGANDSDANSQLMVIQKVVPGTAYSSADIQSKSFVYHQLTVGANSSWSYGDGTTSSTGAVNIGTENSPAGHTHPGAVGATISIDGNGVVTMSGADYASYQGFLSDDKKTIVGTQTDGSTDFELMIIQVTGQTYTAGTLPVSILASHSLYANSDGAGWAYANINVATGGVVTFNDWMTNSGGSGPIGDYNGDITASGVVTIEEDPSFHGQMSHDGNFIVATQTPDTDLYGLTIITRPGYVVP